MKLHNFNPVKDFTTLEFERSNLLVNYEGKKYYYRGLQNINGSEQAILCSLESRNIELLSTKNYIIKGKNIIKK